MAKRSRHGGALAAALYSSSAAVTNNIEPITYTHEDFHLWMPYALSSIKCSYSRKAVTSDIVIFSRNLGARWSGEYTNNPIPYKILLLGIRIIHERCCRWEWMHNGVWSEASRKMVCGMLRSEQCRLSSLRSTTQTFMLLGRSLLEEGTTLSRVTGCLDVMHIILGQVGETVGEVEASMKLLNDLKELDPGNTHETCIVILEIMRGCDARGEMWD